MKIIAGIDPGVKTGIAIWDCEDQKFILIQTAGIIKAISICEVLLKAGNLSEIWFEDARQRKWFGKSGREVLQGAGSIKRDCKIWQEFCELYEIKYKAIPPQKGQTKWKSDYFKRITGLEKRTSEHSRDAAALVFGAK